MNVGMLFLFQDQRVIEEKKNHVKDLWCPFCKKVVKTTEIKPNDYFVSMDKEIYYYRR